MSTHIPQDFRSEYDAVSLKWLRRRFLWFSGLAGAASLAIGTALAAGAGSVSPRLLPWILATLVIQALVCLVPFVRALRSRTLPTRQSLLRRVGHMLAAVLVLQIIPSIAIASLINSIARSLDLIGPHGSLGPIFALLGQTLVVHLFASLLVPWTPREAIKPLIPFLLFLLAISLAAPLFTTQDDPALMLVFMPLATAVGIPGVLVAWWRQSRFSEVFTNRAVRTRYAELSAELSMARRIHDRLFPLPITDGPLRVEFAYEPMRQIGGDIVYARRSAANTILDLVLIDVTGHGIAAALVVNRLHAELNRIYGSNETITPRDIIDALNSYACLTMADEGFYATALCLRIEPPLKRLTFSNAGHPPAFLFHAGISRPLESTTLLLGAAAGSQFEPAQASVPFEPGDVLYVYSDGALEARNAASRMLGLTGLADLLKGSPSSDAVVRLVQAFRDGPAQDDMLVVRIEHRPL